jgi:hypothetical protein
VAVAAQNFDRGIRLGVCRTDLNDCDENGIVRPDQLSLSMSSGCGGPTASN